MQRIVILLLTATILAMGLRCSGTPVQVRGNDAPARPSPQEPQETPPVEDEAPDDAAPETGE